MSYLQCYAIKDEKAGFFMTPAYVKNVVEAIRGFTTLANSPGNNVSMFPADYSLYLLHHLDEESGISKFTSSGVPELVSRAVDVLKPSINGGSFEPATQKA